MDYITVRITGDYSEKWDGERVELKFSTGDRFSMSKREYKSSLKSMKLNLMLDQIAEIVQKKANVTQIKLLSNDSITVNSKHGLRLFQFLNGGKQEFDVRQTREKDLQMREAV